MLGQTAVNRWLTSTSSSVSATKLAFLCQYTTVNVVTLSQTAFCMCSESTAVNSRGTSACRTTSINQKSSDGSRTASVNYHYALIGKEYLSAIVSAAHLLPGSRRCIYAEGIQLLQLQLGPNSQKPNSRFHGRDIFREICLLPWKTPISVKFCDIRDFSWILTLLLSFMKSFINSFCVDVAVCYVSHFSTK